MTTMMTTYFKVLGRDGRCLVGAGRWPLPAAGGEPGAWTPPVAGPLAPYRNGYHLCRPHDLLVWSGPAIFAAEPGADRLVTDSAVVARTGRLLRRLPWDEPRARRFARDCVAHVLAAVQADIDPAVRAALRAALVDPSSRPHRRALAALAARSPADPAAIVARALIHAAAGGRRWPAFVIQATAVRNALPTARLAAEREWQTRRLLAVLLPPSA